MFLMRFEYFVVSTIYYGSLFSGVHPVTIHWQALCFNNNYVCASILPGIFYSATKCDVAKGSHVTKIEPKQQDELISPCYKNCFLSNFIHNVVQFHWTLSFWRLHRRKLTKPDSRSTPRNGRNFSASGVEQNSEGEQTIFFPWAKVGCAIVWSPVFILVYHSRDFIGYVVLKIWRHTSRFARLSYQPRLKLNLGQNIAAAASIWRNWRTSTTLGMESLG